mgnify:CR=1 FL=1
MAKGASAVEAKPNIFQRLAIFFQEVRSEMQKVTWPTMEDLKVSTYVCILLLMIMAVITYGLDLTFNWIILQFFDLVG